MEGHANDLNLLQGWCAAASEQFAGFHGHEILGLFEFGSVGSRSVSDDETFVVDEGALVEPDGGGGGGGLTLETPPTRKSLFPLLLAMLAARVLQNVVYFVFPFTRTSFFRPWRALAK